MSGVLQLLFDHNTSPATTTDATALLYAGPGFGAAGGGPAQFSKSTNQRWSCTFTLIDHSGTHANCPSEGQEFRLLEDGVVRFSGFIDQIDEGAQENSTTVLYVCSCSSWASLFDRRVVTKVYQQNEAASTVIADIVATLGEGITTTNVIVSGTLTTPIALDGPTIASQAFDTIRDMVNAQWWVDENKDLHFVPVNAGPALPFGLDSTGVEWLTGTMKVTRTTKDYRNTQYVTSTSLGQPPPSTVTSNPAPAAAKYTLLTDTYVTAGPLDFFVMTSQPIQQDPSNPIAPTVTVNGVAQTVKQYFSNSFGSNAWYWTPNGIGVQQGQQIAPAPGSTIVITYQAFAGGGGTIAPASGGGSNTPSNSPATKNWVVTSNSAEIAARAAIEGDSGKWEQVTSVPGISDPATAGALATGLLARSDTIPTVIQYDTYRSNYAIGSKLTVNVPWHGINGTFTVQEVHAREVPYMVGPISGQTMLYSIILSDQQNIGNYVKWFEGLIRSVGVSAASGGGVSPSVTPSQPGIQIVREQPSGVKNGTNVTFTLTFSPQPPWAVWLYVNGVLQHELGSIADYSLSGSTITFTAAPKSTDEISCIYLIANAGLSPQKVNVTAYSTGAYQNDGDVDAHWTQDAGAPAYIVNTANLPPAWIAAPVGSRWISAGPTGIAPSGAYKFKMLFQMPATSGTLSGYVAADDDFNLKLNGVSIASGGFASWVSLHAFTTSGPFIAGTNTLEVDVNEDGSGGFGVLVVITQATSP